MNRKRGGQKHSSFDQRENLFLAARLSSMGKKVKKKSRHSFWYKKEEKELESKGSKALD